MTNIKLTYFNIDGGRAEAARIALHSGGIAFEDHRIAFPEFADMRGTTPFNSIPVMELDGQVVTQSNAINRYVGKLVGLYPEDPLQALFCDEAMDAVEDVMHYMVQTFSLKGDELKAAREKLADGWFTVYINGLNGLLSRGGDYFSDNRLTVADLKVFIWVRSVRSGNLDHVPVDLVDRLAPDLVKHQERVEGDPRVVAYYAERG